MATEIDQQFIEYVIKSLVSNPDAVQVERSVDERGVLLELTVDPEDLGRVIGKRGATAQSLRTLLRALGTKNDARYNLKIVDNGEPKPKRDDNDSRSKKADSDADDKSDDVTSENDDEAIQEAKQIVEAEAEPIEEEKDDLASKTRRELAELDDLDV